MELIVEWVMRIVVFILIATIIELIIPESTLKRYVNLVIGLILILIFAQPVLHFLKVDLTTILNQAEKTILQEDESELRRTKNLIENQKKDIQAEQDAYILDKVKEQLIEEASPTLKEEYHVNITNIEFLFHDKYEDKYEDLKQLIVTVHLQKNLKNIKPIVINIEKDKKNDSTDIKQLTEDITTSLKHIWDLRDKKVVVKWEGGTS